MSVFQVPVRRTNRGLVRLYNRDIDRGVKFCIAGETGMVRVLRFRMLAGQLMARRLCDGAWVAITSFASVSEHA